MAKSKNAKPKPRLTDWHFKPDEDLSEKAGYPVKNHGHRHYMLRLKVDAESGEIYLPVGYKWVSFIRLDNTVTGDEDAYVFVLVKDEIHG